MSMITCKFRRGIIRRLFFWVLFAALLAEIFPSVIVASKGQAVRNKFGICVKLITKRDCRLYGNPDEASRYAPCDMFNYWYVLPPEPLPSAPKMKDLKSLTRNGFYRVSTSHLETGFQGWIHQDDVILWHHRQVLSFAPTYNRDLARFYVDGDDARTAANTGNVSKATHCEPRSAKGNLILMPLLQADDVKISGTKSKLFKVAFLAAPNNNYSNSNYITIKDFYRTTTVDIVFVLDTTHSMSRPIYQVLQSISRVIGQLAKKSELRDRLRFGLVAFRDSRNDIGPQNFEYLTRVFCTLEEGHDHKVFRNKLKSVAVAVSGIGDYPEDVLAGLDAALDFDRLGWNATAFKLIVIVGDSSIKESDHPRMAHRKNDGGRTIAAIKAKAQPGGQSRGARLKGGFMISAVLVRDPRYPDEHQIAEKQYRNLVHGREYNGFLLQALGGVTPEDFSGQLTKEILEELLSYEHVIKDREKANPEVIPPPVVDMIRTLRDDQNDANLDMSFAARYCTEFDTEGNRLFVPHVFVRKNQIEIFVHMMAYLQTQLEDVSDPGGLDVQQIVSSLKIFSTSLNLSEPITGETPLNKILEAASGLPLRTLIFSISAKDLAAMSQTDFEDWVKTVKVSEQTLRTLIENPNIWYKLHKSGKEKELHGFVALADLP